MKLRRSTKAKVEVARTQPAVDWHQLATTDPLTGVANRTLLMDRLAQSLRRLDRVGGMLVVLYIDIDRFKQVNDHRGHRVGDEVLLQLVERIAGHVRPPDTIARLGGDEFVLVAENVGSEGAAMELANRIVEVGRKPIRVGKQELTCTVSVGVAFTSDAGCMPAELLHEADFAMYRAKSRGRDRAEVFDEGLRSYAVDRLATERRLRTALADGGLVIQYQPIVDLNNHDVVCAEALLRVRDGEIGLMRPASFMGVAEESGLLSAMDDHVLDMAVQEAATWRSLPATPAPMLAVNVTRRQLASPRFPDALAARLDECSVPRDRLQIEVTERVLMEVSSSAMARLRALREAGVRVALDDFGTGYSSLVHLRQFPLDFVKIDRSYIAELGDGAGKERSILAALVSLSHALDLTVIAEGVETNEQLQAAREVGCDQAQGFLLAGSLSPDGLREFMSNGSVNDVLAPEPLSVPRHLAS